MTTRLLRGLGVAVVAATCTLAQASDAPSWYYAELGYDSVDAGDIDGDGIDLELAGSLDFVGLPIFATLDYADISLDNDVDFEQLSFAVGGYLGIGTKANPASVYAALSLEDISGYGTTGADDDGPAIQVGARGMLTPNLELHARSKYTDYSDLGSDLSFRFGATYRVWGPIFANLDYESQTDLDIDYLHLGVRYSYY